MEDAVAYSRKRKADSDTLTEDQMKHESAANGDITAGDATKDENTEGAEAQDSNHMGKKKDRGQKSSGDNKPRVDQDQSEERRSPRGHAAAKVAVRGLGPHLALKKCVNKLESQVGGSLEPERDPPSKNDQEVVFEGSGDALKEEGREESMLPAEGGGDGDPASKRGFGRLTRQQIQGAKPLLDATPPKPKRRKMKGAEKPVEESAVDESTVEESTVEDVPEAVETQRVKEEGASVGQEEGVARKGATCPICFRTFKSNKAMYGHQRTHDKGSGAPKKTPKKVPIQEEKADVTPPKREKVKREAAVKVKAVVTPKAEAVDSEPRAKLKKKVIVPFQLEGTEEAVQQKTAPVETMGSDEVPKKKKKKILLKAPTSDGVVKKKKKKMKGKGLAVKKPGLLKPGWVKKGLPGTFIVKAGKPAVCPICLRTFKSDKAMHGHQRSHTSTEAAALIEQEPESEPPPKPKKLKAAVKPVEVEPVKAEAPEEAGEAATCPICKRTFGSKKAMYGHQRTHDLTERSTKVVKKLVVKTKPGPKGGLAALKIRKLLKLAKKASSNLAGPPQKKEEPGPSSTEAPAAEAKQVDLPASPSVVVHRRKKGLKALQRSLLLARSRTLGSPILSVSPRSDPDLTQQEPHEGVAPEVSQEPPRASKESPAHTPGGGVPTCPVCKRTFMSNKAMYGHQRTHGGGVLPAARAMMLKKKLSLGQSPRKQTPAQIEEQGRFSRLRSRAKSESLSADEVERVATGEGSLLVRPRSSRLPVFEALGGGARGTVALDDPRGAAMQGNICSQGRPAHPPLRTIVAAEDALAQFGGFSVKGIMQNVTAGSLVAPCLECGGGCYSQGRAWLRCQGGCARYIHQKCTARPRMKGPPPDGSLFSCWDCRRCHSCDVRLLDAPEAGLHKERQYTLCPPCAKLWSMHNYCTACEKVYYDDYVGEPMVQCNICFHWCHAACESFSPVQYATLVEDPNSVFHCSRCLSGTRKPAPRPISEAEAIAEAAAEKLLTKRKRSGSPRGIRSSVLDEVPRRTGSLQQLTTDEMPKPRGRPKSASQEIEDQPLVRNGFGTVSAKRARSNAAVKASRLKSAQASFRGWGKSFGGTTPRSPGEGQEHSRTGRKLKTPARLMEFGEQAEEPEGDLEELDADPLVAPPQPWKKKLAASVVAAKLGRVAGKRKRFEGEETLQQGPESVRTPEKQVTFDLKGTPSPRKAGGVKVGTKQRIRHLSSAEQPWCGDRKHPPQAVTRFLAEALCALESCKVCGGLGDRDEDDYLCCVDCGEAYHSFCLDPPLRRTEKLRQFWRCPTCKLCDACGQNEDRVSMILCSICDASYHERCLDERVAPNEKQVKLGWVCPGCSCCPCGTKLGPKPTSMRWFPRSDGSVMCTKCLRQKSRGHLCSVCKKAFADAAAKDINECGSCFLKVHAGCDPDRKSPKPGNSYHCPSCRKSAAKKKNASLALQEGSQHASEQREAPPFGRKVQPPTLIVESAAAPFIGDAPPLDPDAGVGELGLTPGTMARLGLDSAFGRASFAEEQQELEADSELAMLLRTGSDVDLTTIGGGLLGSLQSPEGLAALQTRVPEEKHTASQEQEQGAKENGADTAGGKGSGKMAAFNVPPLIVNNFVSPGASSGSPFGLLFSQRSDQVALPNFLPGQLDTPNVIGPSLWSSPPADATAGGQLAPDAKELPEDVGRRGPLSEEEKQRVKERMGQLDASNQARLQRFLDGERAKQEVQQSQVDTFMQKHSKMLAEREGGAHRPLLSPPEKSRGPSPGIPSPNQNLYFPVGAEQTYLRPDSHPLLSPPDQEALAAGNLTVQNRPELAQQAAELASYWDGQPAPSFSLNKEAGLANGPPQLDIATNANAAETFLKRLPPQLSKELTGRFPDGVPPSVLSSIAQHLVRVSTQQQQQQQNSPHARNPLPLGMSPLSPAGMPYMSEKNVLAALQMPPPQSVRSPRLQQGGGNGLLRGQALRSSPTFMAQWKRAAEKGHIRPPHAPWEGPHGGHVDQSTMMARMAAAKRSMTQIPSLPSPTDYHQPNTHNSLPILPPALDGSNPQLALPSSFPAVNDPPLSEPMTSQQLMRKAELEHWVIQKYNELLQNPEGMRRMVQMHGNGALPADISPHISIVKKLISDQQKASGIQAKYTALILACQKQALAQGDRKRAQQAIRGLQQKQEEEKKRALAEQQEFIGTEASRMAIDIVEKEAASTLTLLQGGFTPRAEGAYSNGFDSLPSPGFSGGAFLPSPESFFASASPNGGGFGSVEKLPQGGGHSALRGFAARSESPHDPAFVHESLQFYPRSLSPLPMQQMTGGEASANSVLTRVASGGLEWQAQGKQQEQEHADKSLKKRKEEMRAAGGPSAFKKQRVLQESAETDSPVIEKLVASAEKLLKQPEKSPRRRMESDSEDEPLIMTASKRALGPKTSSLERKEMQKAGPKMRKSLGEVLPAGKEGTGGGLGEKDRNAEEKPRSGLRSPSLKKQKRKKLAGNDEEQLLLAQHARQRISQLLKDQRAAKDEKAANLYAGIGQKRIEKLESDARQRLEGVVTGETGELAFVMEGGRLAVSLPEKAVAEQSEGPVDQNETQQGGSKKRKLETPPRGKKQRSSHRVVRQAVRLQMAVKPARESSRGADSPGRGPGGAAMWSEKWWLQKWRREEKAGRAPEEAQEGASSGEDVPIGQALVNKGAAEKRFGSKRRRLGNRTPAEMSEPLNDSDPRTCTLCRKGAHKGGCGRLLYCGPATWVHINCIMWGQQLPRLPGGELWFVHSFLLRAWKARCTRCEGFGASVGCASPVCTRRFHFPCALKSGALFVQGGRVYCSKHATRELRKRMIGVQGDTHFARARAFVEPWWAQENETKPARGEKQGQEAGQDNRPGEDKSLETAAEGGQQGLKAPQSHTDAEKCIQTAIEGERTGSDEGKAETEMGQKTPELQTEAGVALKESGSETVLNGADSAQADTLEPMQVDGALTGDVSNQGQVERVAEREASGTEANCGTEDMQIDVKSAALGKSENIPPGQDGGPQEQGSGPLSVLLRPPQPDKGVYTLRIGRVGQLKEEPDSSGYDSSPRRSPSSFAPPVGTVSKGKRAKRGRLLGGRILEESSPPPAEKDDEAPTEIFGGEGPHLVQFLRVGALSVESLGEVAHDQRGFQSLTQLYPVGFRAWRVHWSTQRPNQRCLYLLEILRTSYGPLFRITAWGEVGKRKEPETAQVNPPMHPITASSLDEAWANLDERIWAMRRSHGVAWKRHRRFWGAAHGRGLSPLSPRAVPLSPKPLNPHFQHHEQGPAACGACCGAWLFGLHVWDVCKRMELLPHAEECSRYKFRHRQELVGRNSKLAECARTAEPWIRHLVERTEDDMAARVAAVKAAQRRTTAFQQVVMEEPVKGTSTSHKADAIVHMPIAMQYRSMRDNLKARVNVGASEIHGKGLFAKTMIMQREMVIEYVGELIRPKISDIREKQYRSQKMGCYFFGFPPSKLDSQEDLVVDATRKGNAARNINHSCSNNCETKAVLINGRRHLIVFARRTLMPNEEITINYCFRSDPTEEKVPCLCGSASCKGFLN